MSQTDLLGDPLPDPLPEGERFTRMEQLVGHTIKAVFEDTTRAQLVIVTDTLCWIPLNADGDGDSTYISVPYVGFQKGLTDFVPAGPLFHSGCITQADYAELKKVEDEAAEVNRQRLLNHHRQQLAALEAKAP